jgi:hypothetical protein
VIAFAMIVVVVLVAVIASQDADTEAAPAEAEPSSVCARTYEMLDMAAAQPDPSPTVNAAFEDQLPTDLGIGFGAPVDRPVPDPEALAAGKPDAAAWIEQLRSTDYQGGLIREWSATAGPVASTEILRFADHEGAIDFQRWIIGASCTSSLDVFAVDDLAGGIGLRISWSNGDVSDQVSFVRGPYRYLTSVRTGSGIQRGWILDVTTRTAAVLGIELPDPQTPCSLVRPPFGHQPTLGGGGGAGHELARLLPRVPPRAATPEGWDGKDTLKASPVFTFASASLRSDWEGMLEVTGFRDRIERDWYTPDGSVDIALERFATHRRAVAYDRWITGNVLCWYARSWFPTSIPDAFGFRTIWGDGAASDSITFVQGRLRVSAVVFGESLPADHAAVRALASAARRRLSEG